MTCGSATPTGLALFGPTLLPIRIPYGDEDDQREEPAPGGITNGTPGAEPLGPYGDEDDQREEPALGRTPTEHREPTLSVPTGMKMTNGRNQRSVDHQRNTGSRASRSLRG